MVPWCLTERVDGTPLSLGESLSRLRNLGDRSTASVSAQTSNTTTTGVTFAHNIVTTVTDTAMTIIDMGVEMSARAAKMAGDSVRRITLSQESDTTTTIMTDGGTQTTNSPELELLNLVTQPTRASLVQNVLGHKFMMPSSKELSYYNPSKSPGTISEHLDKLVDSGILMRIPLPASQRKRDLPNVFFTLSDLGYQLLEEHSLFLPQCEQIRADHARLEKTEEIRRYEDAPRPTLDVNYDHPLQGDGISVVDPTDFIDEDGGTDEQSQSENTCPTRPM